MVLFPDMVKLTLIDKQHNALAPQELDPNYKPILECVLKVAS